LNVVRSKPAAHAFVLQVSVEAVGERLVFGGIVDEALHQSQNRLAADGIASPKARTPNSQGVLGV
jgi:hypothetical protein